MATLDDPEAFRVLVDELLGVLQQRPKSPAALPDAFYLKELLRAYAENARVLDVAIIEKVLQPMPSGPAAWRLAENPALRTFPAVGEALGQFAIEQLLADRHDPSWGYVLRCLAEAGTLRPTAAGWSQLFLIVTHRVGGDARDRARDRYVREQAALAVTASPDLTPEDMTALRQGLQGVTLDVELARQIARHSAADETSWWWLLNRADRQHAITRVVTGVPAAMKIRRLRRYVVEWGAHCRDPLPPEIFRDLCRLAPRAEFAEYFRSLVALDATMAGDALRTAREAQLRGLLREDIAPVLEAGSHEARLAALAALAHVEQPPMSTGRAARRAGPTNAR